MNIQKNIFPALISVALLLPGMLSARLVPPPAKFGMNNMEVGSDPIPFMFILSGGFLAGGKQNTCYLVKGRVIMKKFSADATMYYHFHGDQLYNANVAVGNMVQLSAGVEFGDRTYFLNKDSTMEHFKFRNVATGEYEPYSSFEGFEMPQEIVSYTIGLAFGGRFKTTNLWRGVGQCWSFATCKWELMYAPKIGYSQTLDIVTQGPYQANTTTYELEGAKVRKFGFRLLFDSRMGGKIGWMMEVGMRPGIRYELNEENRFSNGYLRMGIVMALSVGGRKELDRPGFGREVPEN